MRRASTLTLGALLLASAAPAHAHLVETGLGGFYDGIAHLMVTPADVLMVLGLALFAGQRGSTAARRTALLLPLAWLLGGFAGAHWPAAAPSPLLTTLPFALTGALVALDARLRSAGVAAFAVLAGLIHGFADGASMAPAGAGPLALVGAVSAVLFLGMLLAAEVSALPAGWPRIVVRVAGSWIAATGMLMFGWLARGA